MIMARQLILPLIVTTFITTTPTTAFAFSLSSSCGPTTTVLHSSISSTLLTSTSSSSSSSSSENLLEYSNFHFAGWKNGNKRSKQRSDLNGNVGAVMPDGGINPCIVRVVGVGGGGCNAVDRMLDTAVVGVDFWAMNTDAQALGRSKVRGANVLNIGSGVTRGLGAGGDPNVGRMAAEESRNDIKKVVEGCDMCFVTSGMGGGTGSGAAPVVAECAREAGALTVGIVTKPFRFEGSRRTKQAAKAIHNLKQHVDSIIVVSNDKLLDIIPSNTPMRRAFAVADDILRQGVVGISDIIIKPGLINTDFADVRSVMKDAGTALMGIGVGKGKTGAIDAAAAAISSPLLDCTIYDAKGVVFNISGGRNMGIADVNAASKLIYESVDIDANVIFGALIDETLGDTISMTVLATGFEVPDVYEGDMEVQQEQNQEMVPIVSRDQERKRGGGALGGRNTAINSPSYSASSTNTKPSSDIVDDNRDIPDFLTRLRKKR